MFPKTLNKTEAIRLLFEINRIIAGNEEDVKNEESRNLYPSEHR